MPKNQKHKITVIGGGTGTSVVLSGLKQYKDCKLSAIVTTSDSGGSTGRLRDEFGFIPVGDLRQCIAALADGRQQEQVRQMLLYRFAKGKGLKGHNLGNLILTALEDISPSPAQAIEIASKIFRINGRVYPITETNVDLVIKYQDGSHKIGENHLDDLQNGGKKIKSIKFSPQAKIYPKAAKTITRADLIIMGPGDLYASLLPNTLAAGFQKALAENAKNQGKFVYIVNLMTHFSQTHQMTAQDHLNEVTKYCGRRPDVVIMNNGPIPAKILKKYAKYKEFPVKDDLTDQSTDRGAMQIIRQDLIAKVATKQDTNDTVLRSLLRHDQAKLAATIQQLL